MNNNNDDNDNKRHWRSHTFQRPRNGTNTCIKIGNEMPRTLKLSALRRTHAAEARGNSGPGEPHVTSFTPTRSRRHKQAHSGGIEGGLMTDPARPAGSQGVRQAVSPFYVPSRSRLEGVSWGSWSRLVSSCISVHFGRETFVMIHLPRFHYYFSI